MQSNPVAIRGLANALKTLIRFEPPRSFVRWAEEELVLPEGDNKGQRFVWTRRPWQKLLAEAMTPGTSRCWSRVVIAAGSQTGKTFFAISYGIFCVAELGDSVQIAAPAETTSTSVVKGKVEPILLANPRLAARALPVNYKPRNKKADFRITCPNGGMMAFPFSGGSMVSYPARTTIGTEHAKMPQLAETSDMTDQLRARADGYRGGWRGVFESTPGNTATRHALDMAAGTCSSLICPCPHCGDYFEAGSLETMAGYEDCDSAEDAAANVTMVCSHCGAEIGEEHRATMQAGARLHHEHPDRDLLSVRVNWLHSIKTFRQFGQAAWHALSKKATRHPTYIRTFYNDYLAQPTDLRIEAAGDVAVPTLHKDNIIALQNSEYRFDQNRWPETSIVVAGIDIGKYDIWWMSAAYLLHNNDMAVLNYGRFIMAKREYDPEIGKYSTPLPSAARLVESLDYVHARMTAAVKPSQTAVDVNYEYYAEQTGGSNPDREYVANWAADTPGVIGVRGVKTPVRNYGKSPLIPSPACEYMQQSESSGRQLINIYANEVKTRLARAVLRTTPGNRIYLPGNALEANSIQITRHLTSEYPIDNGNGRLAWHNDGTNHLWDCLVYAYSMGILQSSIFAQDHRDEYERMINRSESALAKARASRAEATPPPAKQIRQPIQSQPVHRDTRGNRRRLPSSATGRGRR